MRLSYNKNGISGSFTFHKSKLHIINIISERQNILIYRSCTLSTSGEIGWEGYLWNDLFCVKCDKKILTQSINTDRSNFSTSWQWPLKIAAINSNWSTVAQHTVVSTPPREHFTVICQSHDMRRSARYCCHFKTKQCLHNSCLQTVTDSVQKLQL